MGNLGFKIKNFKFWIIIFIFTFCVFNFIGCATIKEASKGFLGISTRSLEEARKGAIIKVFNYDYSACYAKTLEILTRMDAYIYVQNIKKHMIAIYISENDTTPVGIFFKEINPANTQVEVSSPSTYAKEFVAKDVFSVLDKSVTLDEMEAYTRAKKEMEDK